MKPDILAIDIGSNTIKCLLGRVENGAVVRLYERTVDSRIMGRGALVANAAELVAAAVSTFKKDAARFSENFSCVAVATSALRDSPKKGEIVSYVAARTGVEIDVISGEAEARLSFSGAMSDPLVDSSKRCAYFDLGGGSMEVVAGFGGTVEFARSLDVGAVRLTRECSSNAEYFERSADAICRQLADFPETEILVGAGGAVVAARLMKQKLGLGGAENSLSLADIQKCYDAVAPLAPSERVEKFSVPAGRADILPAAFACIIELMRYLRKISLIHTFNNMRYGLVLAESRK